MKLLHSNIHYNPELNNKNWTKILFFVTFFIMIFSLCSLTYWEAENRKLREEKTFLIIERNLYLQSYIKCNGSVLRYNRTLQKYDK